MSVTWRKRRSNGRLPPVSAILRRSTGMILRTRRGEEEYDIEEVH